MLPAGQHSTGAGGKQVRKEPAVAAVAPRQGLPQALGRGRVPAAGDPGHDAPAGALDGQPPPDFTASAPHKGPQLIEFEGLPRPLLGFFRPQAGRGRRGLLRFFLPVWPPSCAKRRSRARCCVASCARPAFLPARSERPARPRLAPSGPGGHRPCSGIWRGPGCCHCAEAGHCRRQRRDDAYKSLAVVY